MKKYGFWSVTEGLSSFESELEQIAAGRLSFGIPILDQATKGIFTDDLVLLGASTGVGKTQFATNLAKANIAKNKKICMFALEASHKEIHYRLLFSFLAQAFFKDPKRERLDLDDSWDFSFSDWMSRGKTKLIDRYQKQVLGEMSHLKNLRVYYKQKDFTVDHLREKIKHVLHDTDLFIIDHAHYFDFEDSKTENEALKTIAKSCRNLTQEIKKPIVLIAHLRKKDRFNKELIPGIDEFHGSSDLAKIATKVLTFASGGPTRMEGQPAASTRFDTFLRIPKSRMSGALSHYAFKLVFNINTSSYDEKVEIGRLENGFSEFTPLTREEFPKWAKATLMI